jgi:hypothetical protein
MPFDRPAGGGEVWWRLVFIIGLLVKLTGGSGIYHYIDCGTTVKLRPVINSSDEEAVVTAIINCGISRRYDADVTIRVARGIRALDDNRAIRSRDGHPARTGHRHGVTAVNRRTVTTRHGQPAVAAHGDGTIRAGHGNAARAGHRHASAAVVAAPGAGLAAQKASHADDKEEETGP